MSMPTTFASLCEAANGKILPPYDEPSSSTLASFKFAAFKPRNLATASILTGEQSLNAAEK